MLDGVLLVLLLHFCRPLLVFQFFEARRQLFIRGVVPVQRRFLELGDGFHFSLREHANISPLVADRVKRFTSRVSTSLPKVIYHDNLSYHLKHCLSFSPLVSQAISLVYAARTPAQNEQQAAAAQKLNCVLFMNVIWKLSVQLFPLRIQC